MMQKASGNAGPREINATQHSGGYVLVTPPLSPLIPFTSKPRLLDSLAQQRVLRTKQYIRGSIRSRAAGSGRVGFFLSSRSIYLDVYVLVAPRLSNQVLSPIIPSPNLIYPLSSPRLPGSHSTQVLQRRQFSARTPPPGQMPTVETPSGLAPTRILGAAASDWDDPPPMTRARACRRSGGRALAAATVAAAGGGEVAAAAAAAAASAAAGPLQQRQRPQGQ